MKQKSLTYFVSDVHLGLQVADPVDRERRFVEFLRGLPEETAALYLLGDIWDFWYEYKHVVPKGYVRVFAALTELIDRGVDVFFFQGNHDVWTYSYFEELGMKKLQQPAVVEIAGKRFCLGHGDGLGPVPLGYRFAFGLGNGWSRSNRLSHAKEYVFKGKDEPLYKFAEEFARENRIDCFVFGHYHSEVHMKLPSGADFIILKDWIHGSPYLCIEG